MAKQRIGVLGATSLVGNYLPDLLTQSGLDITAYTRRGNDDCPAIKGVDWVQLDLNTNKPKLNCISNYQIDFWISVLPIWILPNLFSLLETYGIKRIVALSSTSLFVKSDSSDPFEKDVAIKLSEGEQQLKTWAINNGIEWIILRPTLIYGAGRDKNVTEIANFIRRFGFFPLFGAARGLRQPVHANDIATACLAALQNLPVVNHSYNLSGGETLTYRDMITRIFAAMGRRPQFVHVPLWFFRLGIAVIHFLPRYRHWTTAMAERMNQDLCFDHSEASRDFGYLPKNFEPFGEV